MFPALEDLDDIKIDAGVRQLLIDSKDTVSRHLTYLLFHMNNEFIIVKSIRNKLAMNNEVGAHYNPSGIE